MNHRSTSVRPVVLTVHELTTNECVVDQSRKEAGSSPGVTIEDEPDPSNGRIAREFDVATCSNESGELYAENVDLHMAVLLDIVTPTAEVAIDDT
uniref:Uncharacterized protein n=1 Tax=Peronospora matthiolae TaxID=2874970 RepID=A0AAV1V3K4_9STRA